MKSSFSRHWQFRACAALVFAGMLSLCGTLHAATATWTGASASTANWSDTGNWLGATPPSANGDTVVFDSNSTAQLTTNNFDLAFTGLIIQINASFTGGTVTINGTGPLSPGAITLSSTALSTLNLNLPVSVAAAQNWTLNGNTLTSTTTGTISATAGLSIIGSAANTATLAGAITLTGSTLTVTGTVAASTVTLNGAIGGSGALTLSTTNLGTVVLGAAANSYTGATTISSGVLSISNVAQLNSTSSIALAGQSAANFAELLYTAATTGTLTRSIALGPVTNSNFVSVNTAGGILISNGNITGGVAGNVCLNVIGAGIFSVENPSHTSNTFLGNVTVDSGGGLRVVGDNNGFSGDPVLLGPGAKTITLQNGGRLIPLTTQIDLTAANTKLISIGTGGGTIDISSAGVIFNDNSQLAGTGLLTIKGNGGPAQVGLGNSGGIANTVNSQSGGITVDNATVNLVAQGSGDPTFLGTGAKTVTLQNGGRLLVNSAIAGTTTASFSTGTKVLAFGNGGGILEVGTGFQFTSAFAGQVAAGTGGTATIRGAGSVTWGSTTAGTTAILHTGPVVIDGGTLNVVVQGSADPTNLGSGVKTVTIQNAGKLQLTAGSGANTNFDPNGGTKSFVIGTGGGTIEVASGFTCTFNDANQLSGSGALTKIGAGTLTLGTQTVGYGGATGYTGGQLNLSAGILNLANIQGAGGGAGGTAAAIAMGAGSQLNLRDDNAETFPNALTVNGNATIDVNRNGSTSTNLTLTVPSLSVGAFNLTVSGGNGYSLSVGPTTLTGSAALANSVPVFITGALSGTGFTLSKSGTGALIVDGVEAPTGPALNVSAGTLSGIGTLTGAVSIGAAALLAPGDVNSAGVNQIGTLALSGGVTSANGCQLGYQLGTSSDLIDAGASNVTMAGALNASAATGFAAGTTYHLLQTTGTITNNLTVGSLPPNTAGFIVVTAGTPNTLDLVTATTTTFTWNGLAGDGEWTTNGNWVGGVAPPVSPNSATAILVFPAGAPLTTHNGYAADTTFNTVGFADNYTVTGNRLQLNSAGSAITANGGATNLNIDLLVGQSGGTITLTAGTLTIGTAGNVISNNALNGTVFTVGGTTGTTCTINSTITGSGNVTASTGGTLALTSANSSYTGITTVGAGATLNAAVLAAGLSNSSIGASSNVAGNLVLSGGTLVYTGSTAATTDRSFTLTAPSSIGVQTSAAVLTLTGSNTGAQTLTKTGSGTLVLGGIADNPSLSATVSAGTLSLAKTSSATVHAIGSSSLTVNSGGILQLGGTGGDQIAAGVNVVVSTGGTFDLNGLTESFNQLNGGGTITSTLAATPATLTVGQNNGSDTFSGVIQNGAGTVNLVKAGTGTQTLSGASTYTGSTTINAGTLALSTASNRLPLGTTVVFGGTATLDLGNNPQTVAGLTISNVSLTATLANAPVAAPLTTPLITFAGNLGATSTLTGGTISIGGGTIDASGFGTVANVIETVASTLIGSGGVTIKSFGDVSDVSGGNSVFNLTGVNTFTGTVTIQSGLVAFNSDASFGDPGNTISLAGGGLLATATIIMPATRQINLAGASDAYFRAYGGQVLTILGPVGGTGNLRKTDQGIVLLAGINTYSGTTLVNNGTVQVGGLGGTFRYYKFQQTALRGLSAPGVPATPNSIQMTELTLFDLGSRLTAVTATNPLGTFPLNNGVQNPSGEGPLQGIDNNTATKWLDFTRGPLILDMGSSVAIDSYNFTTGNDSPERDPISWVLSGSNDNVNFMPIDVRFNQNITFTRIAVTQNFAPTFAPAGLNNLAAANAVSAVSGATAMFINNQTIGSLNGVAGSNASLLGGILTLGDATNPTFSGTISGTGSIVKNGSGNMTISGGNTFTGGITINTGTITTAAGSTPSALNTPLGSGNVTLNGGTLSLGVQGVVGQSLLTSTGWNADVVRAVSDANVSPWGTTDDVDSAGALPHTGYFFYEHGAVGATQTGLPNGGFFTSSSSGIAYQLQSYTANNVLRTVSGTPQTLTVSNGANLYSIHILDMGGGGAASYSALLTYSDLSTTNFTGLSAPDWFNDTPAFALGDVGRQSRGSGAVQSNSPNPRLFEVVLTLSAADSLKTLSSITFTNTASVLDVFAITAVAQIAYPNNIIVNANSTINVTNVPSAQISGTMTLGTNTLFVTGGSVTVGGTTLTGNPTFDAASGAALSLGAVTDGGTARTINKNNSGGLTFSAAATSLINGTLVNVNGGTLNSNVASALGTLANVTLAAGATGAINANQTFGALNGAATSSFNLNAHTLTVGSTNNLSSTFSGAIADGTTAGNLIKAGTGTLTLSGANTYTGTTEVAAGRLQMNGSLPAGGGITTVDSGATLGGTGSIQALVSNGTVAPGTVAAVGTLAASGGTFNSGSTLAIRIPSLSAGQFDLLNMSGGTGTNLTIGSGAVLQLDLTSLPAASSGEIAVVTDVAGSGVAFTPSFINGASNPTHTVSYRNTGTPHAVLVAFGGTTPTPVKLDGLSANADGAGVLLSWNAISELQNAGFNLYRRKVERSSRSVQMEELHSTWTRVNPALIAGRITSPDFKTYRFYDWNEPGAYEYKLESVSIAGATELCAPLAGPVTIDLSTAALSDQGLDSAVSSIALAGDTARGAALSAKFAPEPRTSASGNEPRPQGSGLNSDANSATPALAFDAHGKLAMPAASIRELSRDSVPSNSVAPVATNSSAAQQTGAAVPPSAAVAARWFSASVSKAGSYTGAKIVYSTPGVLKIPTSMLPAGFNPNHVSIAREGRAQTALALASDGLVLFGQGYQDDYTDKDAIFLRNSSAATPAGQLLHAQGLFSGIKTVNVDSPASATASYHDVYYDFNYRPYSFPPWFSGQYLTDGSTQTFSLATPNASSGAASLIVNLWSLTDGGGVTPDHALQVLVNGQPVGQATWTSENTMMQLSFEIASGMLVNGANQIDLVTPALDGVSNQLSFLHSMTMSYTQLLDGSKPLQITNAGIQTKLFEVSRMPSAEAWVVDARYPDRAVLVAYEAQAQADGTYTLRFNAAAGGSGQFLVVPAGQENLPIAISKRQVKPAGAASYLAVGPGQFSAGVQPLLTLHAKEGLRGAFVDQEQIFDYYNYGRYGPAAIQSAVRSVRPQFLLLLGRTTYDYRNYSGLNVDPLCPTFLVSTTMWAQATSDSMFGDLGRGYPEVAVGRLPVNNASELSGALAHVLNNKALSTGFSLHAVADQFDETAGDFASEADSIASAHPDVNWQRNYLGVTYPTSPEVTAAMTTAANGGADMLMYIGHGNAVRLGNEVPRILDNDKVSAWTGDAVFLQSTCTANWMAKDESGYQSIAIQALTQPQGGISASIASSTYMASQNATAFMNQLLLNANVSGMRWGTAVLKTQQWASAQAGTSSFYADLSTTEQIFGDSAMPVLAPAAKSNTGSTKTTTTPAQGQF